MSTTAAPAHYNKGRFAVINDGGAPIAQSAEAVDLKSIQSGFESQWGHHLFLFDLRMGHALPKFC